MLFLSTLRDKYKNSAKNLKPFCRNQSYTADENNASSMFVNLSNKLKWENRWQKGMGESCLVKKPENSCRCPLTHRNQSTKWNLGSRWHGFSWHASLYIKFSHNMINTLWSIQNYRYFRWCDSGPGPPANLLSFGLKHAQANISFSTYTSFNKQLDQV